MADSGASGGLNNEGMQILVTNRAVEMAQNVYNKYMFPFLMKQFGITDWKIELLRSEEEDNIARLRRREIEINMATQIKNLGFEVDMDEEGNFVYKKFPPKQEVDAGTNVDASQLGQIAEEAMTRNKPSMSVGPPQRNTGLPAQAANNNVDRRTERRVG